jgi:regulatory protein
MDQSILKKIANYCVYQERCHSEIIQKLKEWKIDPNEAEEYCAWLSSENYLNEQRFAKVFASSKFRLKKWGKEKIKYELQCRKISKNCITEAMKEIESENYQETIKTLISKKQESLDPNDPNNRKKIMAFLFSKGYKSDEVLDFL